VRCDAITMCVCVCVFFDNRSNDQLGTRPWTHVTYIHYQRCLSSTKNLACCTEALRYSGVPVKDSPLSVRDAYR
jgi:hypothetical protein